MSKRTRDWAWKQQVPATQKIILLALAEPAEPDGHVYHSLTELSIETGLNRTTIWRSIEALEEAGKLRREKTNRPTGAKAKNHYWLSVPPLGAERTYTNEEPDTPETLQPAPRIGAQDTQDRCTEQPPLGAERTHNNRNTKPELKPEIEPEQLSSPVSPSKPRRTPAKPKELSPVTLVREAVEQLRGGKFPNPAKENAAIKRMLDEGYDHFEILDCYSLVGKREWYQTNPLSLQKVAEYMPQYRRGVLQEKQGQWARGQPPPRNDDPMRYAIQRDERSRFHDG